MRAIPHLVSLVLLAAIPATSLNVHPETLLNPLGSAWLYNRSSTINMLFSFKVPVDIDIPVVRAFCGTDTSKKNKKRVESPGEAPSFDDVTPNSQSLLKHYIWGPLLRGMCNVTDCAPSNTSARFAENNGNFSHYIGVAGKLITETEQISMFNHLLRRGEIPLKLRMDSNLQKAVLDRSIPVHGGMDATTAMKFAKARPLVCQEDSILFDLELIDFREAVAGSYYEIMHAGRFESDRSSFIRYDLLPYLFVDERGNYQFVDLDNCRTSVFGTAVCESSQTVIATSCNLTTLAGCFEEALHFKLAEDKKLSVVTQFGTSYVVATTEKRVQVRSTSAGKEIFMPSSGIARFRVPQGDALVVSGKEYPGLDVRFEMDSHDHQADSVVRLQQLEENSLMEEDDNGNKYYRIPVEEEKVKNGQKKETYGKTSKMERVWSIVREEYWIMFFSALADILIVFILVSIVNCCCGTRYSLLAIDPFPRF